MRRLALACCLLAIAQSSCTDERDSTDEDPWEEPDPDPDPDPEPVPEPVCGDGLAQGAEACDRDTLDCLLVDPEYVTGTAACLGDCSGYDTASCMTPREMAELIGTAAEITGQAQIDIMGLDLVGMHESEVKVVVDASFAANGSDPSYAFEHIVASGPNALNLHYEGGGRMIEDGDLLLADIGARYLGYCGDISRTIPASGVFTDRQREIYQLVLDAQSAVAAAWRPGVDSLEDMDYFTLDFFQASPLRALDEYGVERTMDYFFPHSVSHYIGTDVHGDDLPLFYIEPAQAGYVFTIEPGLYIPSEGIGIRIEDDYILTRYGAVNLAPDTPKTIEDIEAAMAAPGTSSFVVETAAILPNMHSGHSDHMTFPPDLWPY